MYQIQLHISCYRIDVHNDSAFLHAWLTCRRHFHMCSSSCLRNAVEWANGVYKNRLCLPCRLFLRQSAFVSCLFQWSKHINKRSLTIPFYSNANPKMARTWSHMSSAALGPGTFGTPSKPEIPETVRHHPPQLAQNTPKSILCKDPIAFCCWGKNVKKCLSRRMLYLQGDAVAA